MSKIRVIKDNAILSIEQEDLAQYEARGYDKLGVAKKVDSKDLKKLAKANEELTKKATEIEKEKEELAKANEELTKKATEIEKEKEELAKANEELTKKVAELEKKIK